VRCSNIGAVKQKFVTVKDGDTFFSNDSVVCEGATQAPSANLDRPDGVWHDSNIQQRHATGHFAGLARQNKTAAKLSSARRHITRGQ